ncbi:multiple sugar transport system permease protein [Friedmanniella endophytica]|uniref:Multiple sugar transport system permease protein n=1 Tax=Microlunatus kandeliicorticis TaxID=1759536 RepID=A0A7W3IU89_9ACTN|nr:sugar ABC transporter permease [Microlunatus kandeliicorticis]MBA8795381.1 multiple sugar transport system permease protein [Microlunatus kandeliicorticis]
MTLTRTEPVAAPSDGPRGERPKRRRSRMTRNQALWCYLFIAPALLGLLLFSLGPMVASFLLSFTSYDLLSAPQWVGLQNYVGLAEDTLFRKSLSITLIYGVVSVPATLLIGLLVAILLNGKIPAMAFFRSAYYLPSVISGVAVAMLWKWLYNGQYGLINTVLGALGIPGPAWLTDEHWALRALIFMSLWGFGGTMLIYLAGLQGVPKELYEAAQVDGASRFRQHLHITVPMLSSVTLFNLIMGIINSLQVFAEPFVLTPNGGPNQSTLLLSVYLYQNAFQYLKMGYASAIAWVSFAIIVVFTLLVFRSTPMWVHNETSEER